MGPANNQQLTSNARNRLLDILHAVSIVESRHGTVGAQQPARDPIQTGNPADSWWRELTGQSGNGSRFVRGPGLSNLWSNEIAAEAERSAGFDRSASLSLLTNRNNGHRDAAFAPAHSYVWGVLYLLHRINSAAGAPTFACGDLSRARLINGAVTYNGGGVPDYEQRIVQALAEFGGLAALLDDVTVAFAPVPQPEPEPEPTPVFGLSPVAALAAMVIAAVVALSLGWFRFGAFAYVDDFTTEAPRIVTTLTVIALFMERALAAINAAWLGSETRKARERLRAAEDAGALEPGDRAELKAAARANVDVETRRQRLRVVLGFALGLVVSGAGVRTLAPLIQIAGETATGQAVPGGQLALLNSVDILLTAGMLAGGSEALAKLAELIRAAVDSTIARFRITQRALRRRMTIEQEQA